MPWPIVCGAFHDHGDAVSSLTCVPSMRRAAFATATSSLMFAVTPKPGITDAPFDGVWICTVGGVVSGALGPNVAMTSAYAFSCALPVPAYVQLHCRALYSPHEPAWFWNCFHCGPDERYVIGSRSSH